MQKMLALLVVAGWSVGAPSVTEAADNSGDVLGQLKHKHVKVILGKHIDHAEYLKFIAAIPGGPPAVAVYLEELIASILKETGGAVAKETVFELLAGKKGSTVVAGQSVYVGIATYNHWTYEKYPEINKGRIKWGTIRVPRPNTHQLYIAIGKREKAMPPDQAKQTEGERRATIRHEYAFFLNTEVGPDWLGLYEPHFKQHGLDVLRDAIVADHSKPMILELFQSLVGESLPDDGLNQYRRHLRNHGHRILEQAIISDYTEKVVKNTYRKILFADPPADWLKAYQPYVRGHGVRTLESQIVADHTAEVVKANFKFLIGKEIPNDFFHLYQSHVKTHGAQVLRGAIVSDHGAAAIKEIFKQTIGRDLPADWFEAYKPFLRENGVEALRKQIDADHKK